MKRTKSLLKYELKVLADNICKSADPMGFKASYWTDWARNIQAHGPQETILYTAHMYQMLPFVEQATEMVKYIKPLLFNEMMSSFLQFNNKAFAEPALRLKAIFDKDFFRRCSDVLQGISATLNECGISHGYLFEDEPYSGALTYDLGLFEKTLDHIKKVNNLMNDFNVKHVITVDPHTTYMMKFIFPQYIPNFNIKVSHYTDILIDNELKNHRIKNHDFISSVVIHDPCVMARSLDSYDNLRSILDNIGIKYEECTNYKKNTFCCGGPIEYAFPELSKDIAQLRINELMQYNKNILVTCPICYLNFRRFENQHNIRVWDLGELLHHLLKN